MYSQPFGIATVISEHSSGCLVLNHAFFFFFCNCGAFQVWFLAVKEEGKDRVKTGHCWKYETGVGIELRNEEFVVITRHNRYTSGQ
jgi:hypothetical protein